ncbi:MAG: tRNA (adenosine(37)-N6)-threonylcarbamoyltransferase complex ATPase subunit type 1 TsaE [bacterium]|nr:tRNA (adenosine(37)-N6)-threonylcarbamoyltransferase complex ATPase subunit type 1 TsaE [bacterium]
MRERITESPEDTEAAGERLGAHLAAGDLLLLAGGLGAGKTTFVRGLARGLGVSADVMSPSFQLVRVYPGPVPLAHCDLYRLQDSSELADLGVEELLESAVVVVEWGDRLVWPGAARLRLSDEAPTRRRLRLEEAPPAWCL